MLIGTYLYRGSYVAVDVEVDTRKCARLTLSRHDRPGEIADRGVAEMQSLQVALYEAEHLVLMRGGWPGAEPTMLASSPVDRELAELMFDVKERGRFPLFLTERFRPD